MEVKTSSIHKPEDLPETSAFSLRVESEEALGTQQAWHRDLSFHPDRGLNPCRP